MAGERFKKLKDAVADKVGDAAGAVNDRVRGGGDGSVPPPPSPEVAARTPLSAAVDPVEWARRDLEQQEAAARTHADAVTAARQAALDAKPLQGPAGAYLYGTVSTPAGADPYADPAAPATPRPRPGIGTQILSNLAGDLWSPSEPAGRLGVAPPIRDLAARQQVADSERAARDEIRRAYRSPEAWPVVVTRVVVPADDQVGGITAALASTGLVARPDLVYGITRVPDRLGGTSAGAMRDPVVEWEIVHACLEPLTPLAAPPEVVWFDGAEPWVARAAGEPSVLDEDLALAFAAHAGIRAEHILGIARLVTTDLHQDDGDAQSIRGVVRGVVVLHRSQAAGAATEQFQSLRWMALPPGPPAGFHVEVLNWAAVASVVHRDRSELAEIPSRFPYLPSTPQELVTAYLETVGIWPGDCASVQVTRDEPDLLWGFGEGTTTIGSIGQGPELPCADGVDRRRLHGTTHVVIAYRDRPAYADGRARWAAYQRDALSADLANETGARRPVQDGRYPDLPGLLQGAARAVDTLGKAANLGGALDRHEGVDFAPHRYCWPPTTGE